MNNKNMSYAKNIQSINFDNRTERKGKQNFKKSVINCVGVTLSNKILDYMKKVEILKISHLIMFLKSNYFIILSFANL